MVKAIQPYLFFNGNCREAMQFYASTFGTQVHMMTYAEGPNCPEGDGDRVMHASINSPDGSALMASDTPSARPIPEGGNFNVCIGCDSPEEQDRIFAALSEGGHVYQQLQDTFWGARFGMLRDKFGLGWMLNYHTRPQS